MMVAVLWAPAQAADAPPNLKDRPLYFQARARLIELGYRPVRFRDHDNVVCGDLCRQAPEVVNCTAGGEDHCQFMFRRQRDGRFLNVWTGEGERFDGASWAPPGDIADTASYHAVLRRDRIAIKAVAARIPPTPVPPTPLCSEPHGVNPCWIKPPPGYRPSRKPSR
jgi:hypothetical protein